MKNSMAFNLVIIPVCFVLIRVMESYSISAHSFLVIVFAIFGIMQVCIGEYAIKYGKASRNRKLKQNIEGDIVKFNLATIMLFTCLCISFVYGREFESIRFICFVAGIISAMLIITSLDMDKGRLLFKKPQ